MTWHPWTSRTLRLVDRGGIVAVITRYQTASGTVYLWALTRAGDGEGAESDENAARAKAEAAYRHRCGLLGSVRA